MQRPLRKALPPVIVMAALAAGVPATAGCLSNAQATALVVNYMIEKPTANPEEMGDLIIVGSFSKLMPPKAGQKVEVQYQGLRDNPSVTLNFR